MEEHHLNCRFGVSVVYRPIASGVSLLLQKVMKNSKLKKREGKASDLETCVHSVRTVTSKDLG